jgi:hypothetical protein
VGDRRQVAAAVVPSWPSTTRGRRDGATRKRWGGGKRSRGQKPMVREASHKEDHEKKKVAVARSP